MFNTAKKTARDEAQRLISGHTTLVVYWALKQAGVLDAMANSPDGIAPAPHAAATNMAEDVLVALIDYAARQNLVILKDGRALLTPNARALMTHEQGTLDFLRAQQPIVESLEHLLARLKTYGNGVFRRGDALAASQNQRYPAEVFPAIETLLKKNHCTHILDLACGNGELLIDVATRLNNVVGVGIGSDGAAVRNANNAISTHGLEKRLIAVTGNVVDVATDTRRTFERIGISTALWQELNCLVLVNVLGEWVLRSPETVQKVLAGFAKNFPKCCVVIAEPTAGPRLEKNHHAAEFELFSRLAKYPLYLPEQWQRILADGQQRVISETPLTTDGITLFVTKPM